MRRAIVILFGLVIAIILFDKILEQRRAAKKEISTPPQTNAVVSRRSQRHLQRDIESPQIVSTNSSSTNRNDDLEWQKLSREQVEAYLLKAKRSSESLLNAFLETGDTNFLAEAVTKDPNNPLVQWTMLTRGPTEERAQWLEKLKLSSPDNALPNYLSALDKLKAGNPEQALAELDAASKMRLDYFERERQQSREEMYLLSGFSPLDARRQSMETLILPNLIEMKALAQELGSLQQKYRDAGDNGSVQQLAALGVEIGNKVGNGKDSFSLVNPLVGYAMENIALKNLDAETYYDFLGKTAGEQIQEIKNQRQEIKDLMQTYDEFYHQLPDTEKMIYLDRSRLYGELNAMKWLKRNYATETK